MALHLTASRLWFQSDLKTVDKKLEMNKKVGLQLRQRQRSHSINQMHDTSSSNPFLSTKMEDDRLTSVHKLT